jgi:WD40 repeat protein
MNDDARLSLTLGGCSACPRAACSGVVLRTLFHPKQLVLVSAGDDAQVRVWDLVTKSCIAGGGAAGFPTASQPQQPRRRGLPPLLLAAARSARCAHSVPHVPPALAPPPQSSRATSPP